MLDRIAALQFDPEVTIHLSVREAQLAVIALYLQHVMVAG
jgi:hypothetical protein